MAIDLARTVLLASGAAMLCLASAILATGPGRTLHRAFAALLALRGLTVLLPQASSDPAWTAAALQAQPYFVLASIPVALYCLLAPVRGGARHQGWWALAAAAGLGVAYGLDHSLFHTLAEGTTANGALRATNELHYTGFGPLAMVGAAATPLLALLGLRYAMRYRETAQEGGSTALLVASGLMLSTLFDGANRLAALVNLLDSPQGYPWLPWGWAIPLLPVLALLPALLTLGVLAAGRQAAPRPHHTAEGVILLLGALAFFSGFLRLVLPDNADPGGAALALVLAGVWRLMMPALIGYAFLREALAPGSPLRQETLAWAALAVILGGSAWVGAAALGGMEPPGAVFGGLAAAILVSVAILPLVRLARGVAAWLLPGHPADWDAAGHPEQPKKQVLR